MANSQRECESARLRSVGYGGARRHDYCSRVTCFFFFQAEDGIRDLTVTGVQTCALPILAGIVPMSSPSNMMSPSVLSMSRMIMVEVVDLPQPDSPTRPTLSPRLIIKQIGRASCRERV